MKHKLSDLDITILEHIVFVAEKSAKTVQFCFKKGEQQYYMTPKQELLVSFKLSTSIKFDYPIANLKTFLAKAANELDSDKIKDDVSRLVLPSKDDIKEFVSKKKVQVLDFTLDNIKTNNQLSKFKYLNIIGENNKCKFRYQNHERSWWFDDGNKKIIPQGNCSRKFRYVIKRDKLRLLPNDYKMILCEDMIQFQLKHLNYYFIPEVSWLRQSVKDWVLANSKITDKHLIMRYKDIGYM